MQSQRVAARQFGLPRPPEWEHAMNESQQRIEAELEALRAKLAAVENVGRRRSRRLTTSNLVLAVLVFTLGGAGVAYAALAAPNSVNSAAIIDRTIGTPDLKVGAIAGQTILDNSMTGLDINESTLELACRSGFSRIGDVCYESEARNAAVQPTALRACLADKLRLPSLSEAMAIRTANSSDAEWTDDAFFNGTDWRVAVPLGQSYVSLLVSDSRNYRCVLTVGARP
jgi:hypothetical protein